MLKWWKLIAGATVPVLVAFIAPVPFLWKEFKSKPPQFALAKPITCPDSSMMILALNRSAARKAPLNVEFDGFLFAGAQVVIDHATGLTWQKAGSKYLMALEQAKTYVENLSAEKYGGYDDWRLPTLIEVMSLMEPEKKNDELHIDPVFDREQRWIWTADPAGESVAWMVDFIYGSCGRDHVSISHRYVRAVRGK